jgi:hypothetical protein
MRTRIYKAASPAQAKEFAHADGTLVDRSLELSPAEVSGELAIAARGQGITVPEGISSLELSDLICLHVWRDIPASRRLQNLASEYGVLVTQYAGEGLLCQKIFNQLRDTPDKQELACWFTYRVYHDLAGEEDESAIDDPDDSLIRVVARLLIVSTDFVQSLFTHYYGADLICFGEWSDSAGMKRKGGSRRTLPYKRAEDLLRSFVINQQQKVRVKLFSTLNG